MNNSIALNSADSYKKPASVDAKEMHQEGIAEANSSYRLPTTYYSDASNDSITSFQELDNINGSIIDIDELPAFDLRIMSPMGRTPSPIISDTSMVDFETPTRNSYAQPLTSRPINNSAEFVALQDIHAQISPPTDSEDQLSSTNNLETIFEGVFLHTPPGQRRNLRRLSQNLGHSRAILFEKVALNRLQVGKENQSPVKAAPSVCGNNSKSNNKASDEKGTT